MPKSLLWSLFCNRKRQNGFFSRIVFSLSQCETRFFLYSSSPCMYAAAAVAGVANDANLMGKCSLFRIESNWIDTAGWLERKREISAKRLCALHKTSKFPDFRVWNKFADWGLYRLAFFFFWVLRWAVWRQDIRFHVKISGDFGLLKKLNSKRNNLQ